MRGIIAGIALALLFGVDSALWWPKDAATGIFCLVFPAAVVAVTIIAALAFGSLVSAWEAWHKRHHRKAPD